MWGPRMRWNSLSGTRPMNTSRSVPRESAPWVARTVTSPAPAGRSGSARISARPGPTYHSACAAPLTRASFIGLGFVPPAISWAARNCMGRGMEGAAAERNPALAGRRVLFAVLVAVTMAAMLWLMAKALAPGGIGALDLAILALFALILPWIVVGFWNATIGFVLMRMSPDPVAAVFPAAARVRGDEPIVASTAILVCIRNEEPLRVAQNLAPLIAGLEASGVADRFGLYVLSDTEEGVLAEREQEVFAPLAAGDRTLEAMYRRRTRNDGFKAGNIADFCRRWGGEHDFAVTLDADSIMPADAVLRMARIMQADPTLGILQGLVVGLPSTSAFARLFQFGMRLGMRSYTIGSAWWQGDCGPYWGHNAILRLKPFIAHCALPELPDGSSVLSHDQIEAVLMRRAGFAVRVLPERISAGSRTRRRWSSSSVATCAGARATCSTGVSCACPGSRRSAASNSSSPC